MVLPAVAEEGQPQQADDQVRGDEPAVLVHEHDPVRVPVEADAQVGLFPQGPVLEVRQVGLHQRIGGVVGEAPVRGVVHGDQLRLQATGEVVDVQRGHPVGAVHHRLDSVDAFPVGAQGAAGSPRGCPGSSGGRQPVPHRRRR